ncbi:hypothetical protein BDN70DRAFT_924745 [Pholiota conissans]|uniref:Mid2 domain-containing protein n=1 Tax=Pholiota conissans TaxID=109636 RepID=A0A9P6CP41_9AGAR|nr:hypothetical protein BDN70DRAFT_924745 [Pholiota conissans]
MHFQLAPSACLFILLSVSRLVYAQEALQAISIDDGDPRITYSPPSSWQLAADGPVIDAGGTHMVTSEPGATAMINYTFVSFFFLSPKWPYKVTTDISIDGGAPVTLDLQDHNTPVTAVGGSATLPSAVVYSFDGNSQSAEHTIVLSVHPGDQFAVVDMFQFFVLPNTTTTSSSSSVQTSTATDTTSATSVILSTSPSTVPSDTSSPTAAMNDSHLRLPTGAIVGLIIGLSLVIVVLFVLLVAICHRRSSRRPSRGISFDESSKHDTNAAGNKVATNTNQVGRTSASSSSSSVDLLVHLENNDPQTARLFVSNPDPSTSISFGAVAPAQAQHRPVSAYSSVLPSYVSRVLSGSFSAEPKFFTDVDPESNWLAKDPVITPEKERKKQDRSSTKKAERFSKIFSKRGSTGPGFDGQDVYPRSLPPSYHLRAVDETLASASKY